MNRDQARELAHEVFDAWPNPRPADEGEARGRERPWRDNFARMRYDVGRAALNHLEETAKKRPTIADLHEAANAIWRKRNPNAGRTPRPTAPTEPKSPPEAASAAFAEMRERLAGAEPRVVPGGDPDAQRRAEGFDYTDPYDQALG